MGAMAVADWVAATAEVDSAVADWVAATAEVDSAVAMAVRVGSLHAPRRCLWPL